MAQGLGVQSGQLHVARPRVAHPENINYAVLKQCNQALRTTTNTILMEELTDIISNMQEPQFEKCQWPSI